MGTWVAVTGAGEIEAILPTLFRTAIAFAVNWSGVTVTVGVDV